MKKMLLILGWALSHSYFSAGQEVAPPKLLKVEQNGVKTYVAQGYESENNSTNTESVEQPIRSLHDFSIEEIENIIYGINLKLADLEGGQNSELIEGYVSYRAQLFERKNELTTNH